MATAISNEYYSATRQEIEAAHKKLAQLHKAKACCGNCRAEDAGHCTIKGNKRVQHYNICIHHKWSR